jgi:hypothetical protein
MTDPTHPASSVEFLSRLYDGEVDAADRATFERHRSACADCRSAAEEFERSLAAFRESAIAPPAVDLSARILRKIRAQSPSRRPFGVMFGIDVRWAGVLVAALLVLLISTPIVLRRPAAFRPAPSAFSARLIDTPVEAKAPRSAPARPAPPAAERNEPASAPPPPFAAKDQVAAGEPAPRSKAEASEAPTDDERRRFAPAPPAAAPAAPALAESRSAARMKSAHEPAGGEGGAASIPENAESLAPRLTIGAYDGEGAAPALVAAPASSRLAPLRGQEFVLTVEAGGHVRSVQPSHTSSDGSASLQKKTAPSASADAAAVADVLAELRFAPGDRPRRLIVRVR